MIIKEERDAKIKVVTQIVCDICKQQINAIDGEVLGNVKRIFFSYSWPSAIADGITAELDVCDACFMKVYYPLIPKEQKRNWLFGTGQDKLDDDNNNVDNKKETKGDDDENNKQQSNQQPAVKSAEQPATQPASST